MTVGFPDWTISNEATIRIGNYIVKTNASTGTRQTIYTVPSEKEFLLMYAQMATHEIADDKEVFYQVDLPGESTQMLLSLYTAITPTYHTKNAQSVEMTPAAPVVYPTGSVFYITMAASGGSARAVLMGFERNV